VRHRLGRADVAGVRVAVQGLGNVGWNLCRLLAAAGAELVVADVRAELVDAARSAFAAEPASPESVHEEKVDVLAPCALGAVLDDRTVPALTAAIVAGGANNQLADEARHGPMLRERGILYVPDYVINAGGMIQLATERLGLDPADVDDRVRAIGATLTEVFERADRAGVPTSAAARELARERLAGTP